jgi:hypothetical protein
MHYTVYTIHCTLYKLYTMRYKLYTIYCTLYTIHYTLYTLYTTYSVTNKKTTTYLRPASALSYARGWNVTTNMKYATVFRYIYIYIYLFIYIECCFRTAAHFLMYLPNSCRRTLVPLLLWATATIMTLLLRTAARSNKIKDLTVTSEYPFFHPEHSSNFFPQNVRKFLPDYMASHPRRRS